MTEHVAQHEISFPFQKESNDFNIMQKMSPSSRPSSQKSNSSSAYSDVEETSPVESPIQIDVPIQRHSIQSRTKSPSHGLSKRERSRSRGRKQYGRITPTIATKNNRSQESYSAPSSEEMKYFNASPESVTLQGKQGNDSIIIQKAIHEGLINPLGRCLRHPRVELCCRDSTSTPWKILLQECPLCSLDQNRSELRLPIEPNKDRVVVDGVSSSQPSTSTTHRSSTEDDSSVKSWTMSDASSVDKDSKSKNSGGTSALSSRGVEIPLSRRIPPPRAPPRNSGVDNTMGNPPLWESSRSSFLNNSNAVSNPVQLLKELGRKLVSESEVSLKQQGEGKPASASLLDVGMSSDALSNRPPPPPFERKNVHKSSSPSSSNHPLESNSRNRSSDSSNIHRQGNRKVRSSSRKGGGGESSIASLGKDGVTNGSLLLDASETIARMESLLQQGGSMTPNTSSMNASHAKQQSDGVGEEDLAERTAAEKLARMRRRKEQALKNAAKLKGREGQKQPQQHESSEVTAVDAGTYSTLDPTSSTMNTNATRRGRDGHGTTDILFDAAQIRERARRSASRSRERLKAAAIFCGETPLIDTNDWEEQIVVNRKLLASERKRSILNPHGLEDPPVALAVERRSQSRERKWSHAATGTSAFEAGELSACFDETAAREATRQRHGRRTRNRANDLPRTANQISAAEELLSRRRDMRQKITEMKSSAQSRIEHRRTGGIERSNDFSQSHDEEEWVHYPNDTNITRGRSSERRRNRSRSAVRNGYSRIRSLSLNVLRKKGVNESDGEDEVQTVNSGRLSLASLKHAISKYRPRSLSLTRRHRNNDSDDKGSWLTDSDNLSIFKRHDSFGSVDGDGYYDIAGKKAIKSEVISTRKLLSNFSATRRSTKNRELIRSLGRGHSEEGERNSTYNERWEAMSEGISSQRWNINE